MRGLSLLRGHRLIHEPCGRRVAYHRHSNRATVPPCHRTTNPIQHQLDQPPPSLPIVSISKLPHISQRIGNIVTEPAVPNDHTATTPTTTYTHPHPTHTYTIYLPSHLPQPHPTISLLSHPTSLTRHCHPIASCTLPDGHVSEKSRVNNWTPW